MNNRPWQFYPDPDEQQAILALPVSQLFQSMTKNEGDLILVTNAAYDLFYAAKDHAKAQALLELTITQYGIDAVTEQVASMFLFLIYNDNIAQNMFTEFEHMCNNTLKLNLPPLLLLPFIYSLH